MRKANSYVQLDPAVIEQARQMDLLTYLRNYQALNLVIHLAMETKFAC